MSRIGMNGIVPALGLLLMIAVGYGAGRVLNRNECHLLVVLACVVGAALALAAWFRRPPSVAERLAAVGLMAYIVAGAVFEPLAFVQDTRGVLVSVAWLFPLVVGGAVLLRRGAWVATVGCWVVLFGGVVALAYNVSDRDGGVGFFISWVE